MQQRTGGGIFRRGRSGPKMEAIVMPARVDIRVYKSIFVEMGSSLYCLSRVRGTGTGMETPALQEVSWLPLGYQLSAT